MVVKLTLTAEKEVVQKARQLAARQNTSISALFDRFIRALDHPPAEKPLGPVTQQAMGAMPTPKKKIDRQLVEEALEEKYGL